MDSNGDELRGDVEWPVVEPSGLANRSEMLKPSFLLMSRD